MDYRMKRIIILLILILATTLTAIEYDKILHFTCSAGIYSTTYDYLNTTEFSMDQIEGYSFWTAILAGTGKELYDVSQGGIFDEEDFLFDIAGVITSLVFKRYIRHREYKQFMIMLGRNKVGVRARW